jgi:hypothetical protein
LTPEATAGLLIVETRTERKERSHEVVRLAPVKVNFGSPERTSKREVRVSLTFWGR